MKKKHYVPFEKKYNEISGEVNDILDMIECLNLAMATDPRLLEKGVDFLRDAFGPLEHFNSVEEIESLFDVKAVLNYGRK